MRHSMTTTEQKAIRKLELKQHDAKLKAAHQTAVTVFND